MRFAFNPFTRMLDVVDIGSSGAGPIDTITGNSGGAVGADAASNVGLTGTGIISVAGNPGTSSLVISASSTVPTSFVTDAGTATPAANSLSILGTAAQGISTSGAGSTVTLTAADATTIAKGVASFNTTNFSVAAGAVSSQNFTVTAGTGLTGGGALTLGGSVTLDATGGGLPTSVQGDMFYASGVDTVVALAKDTNATRYLSNTGATNNPAWAQVALATGVSGELPLANGGTNANLTASNGGIFYSTASAGAILSGTATAGQILRSGSSAAPTWSTATYPATAGTSGNILTSDGTNWASTTPTNAYTESTFTPTLVGGTVAGTTTYTSQVGNYFRIGNMVTVIVYVAISAATGTGDLILGGLPFTIKNQTNGYVPGPIFWQGGASWTWPTGATDIVVEGILNSITALVWASGTAIAGGFMQMANASLAVNYQLTYQV